MNKLVTLLSGAAWLGLTACSNIAEDERLIYVEPAPTARHILIEDFTGQKCVNCPKATELIRSLQLTYGEENIIPVAIHCGSFGIAAPKGLMTDLGQTYGNETASQLGQPSGRINRSTVATYTAWTSLVADVISQPTSVELQLASAYNDSTRQLDITSTVLAPVGTSGHYQLWLTEDSITAIQAMPDGQAADRSYLHNHVLREAINGTWGEEITVGEETLQLNHSYTLPAGYVAGHCSIVAFLYNDREALQVTLLPINNQ